MPKRPKTNSYAQHKERWKGCTECGLCHTRHKIVLARGRVPAHVVFIGEAPGSAEDILGRPFVGPAGKLLDRMVAAAVEAAEAEHLRLAFTNLVACLPKTDGKKREPNTTEIEACSVRLQEFIDLCDPTLLVRVGRHSAKYVDPDEYGLEVIDLTHPAAILRADVTQKGIVMQRNVVTLAEALNELVKDLG